MMKKLIELSDVSICIKKRCILENFSVSFSDETGVIGLVGLNIHECCIIRKEKN